MGAIDARGQSIIRTAEARIQQEIAPPAGHCPQCTSLECGRVLCRFTGLNHGAPRTTSPFSSHDFRDRWNPDAKVDHFTLPPDYSERGQFGRGGA